MKYNKGFAPVLIVLIVMGVLATGGGAYYLGKNSKNIPIQNTERDNSILPDSFSMEMYGDYDSSGADRTYQGELTFKNNQVKNGSQVYIVGEGRNCQENCNRKTECIAINQKWVDKTTGGECTIDAYSTPLTKEEIIQKINEGKLIQTEDLSKCKHSVTCYKITNARFNNDKVGDNSKQKENNLVNNLSRENITERTSTQEEFMLECKHDKLGISFNYPKDFFYDQKDEWTVTARPNCIFIVPDESGVVDSGKIVVGYIASINSNFTMFVGGATKDISFGGSLNASDVQSYPDESRIKLWNDSGYRTEKKTNKNGHEYILVHGQKEVDMPYISENQLLVVFKLKSAVDFPAIGFQLVNGDTDIFYKIIDSIEIF